MKSKEFSRLPSNRTQSDGKTSEIRYNRCCHSPEIDFLFVLFTDRKKKYINMIWLYLFVKKKDIRKKRTLLICWLTQKKIYTMNVNRIFRWVSLWIGSAPVENVDFECCVRCQNSIWNDWEWDVCFYISSEPLCFGPTITDDVCLCAGPLLFVRIRVLLWLHRHML